VINQSPLESEAETLIQHALEEIDPTKSGQSDAQQTILGGIPADAISEATSLNLVKSKLHRKTTVSTAEQLYAITANLQELHQDSSLSPRQQVDEIESASNVDTLVKNAETLVQRHRTGTFDAGKPPRPPLINRAETESKDKPSSANDRWKKLAKTVHTTAAMGNTKKTDEAVPVLEQNENGDVSELVDDLVVSESGGSSDNNSFAGNKSGSGAPESSSGRKNLARKTIRGKAVSGYRDFEGWLKFKKISVWSYTRFVLFFVMIPATALAALLYYVLDNPPCGTSAQCRESINETTLLLSQTSSNSTGTVSPLDFFSSASISWWLIFVCVRQVTTLSLSLATQAFLIDFLALRANAFVRLVGPLITLVRCKARMLLAM
jgi:hypothetical protein